VPNGGLADEGGRAVQHLRDPADGGRDPAGVGEGQRKPQTRFPGKGTRRTGGACQMSGAGSLRHGGEPGAGESRVRASGARNGVKAGLAVIFLR
jgi:hypothetical protein